ncbi:MAG: transporter [Cyclobacteriaceae bacterium]|nr:transporter [Cyclobacteriaceae bacterium HetDA_MAG_MS6]
MKLRIVIPALLLSTNLLAGGGWTEKKGEGFFKLSQYNISASKFFDGNGDRASTPTINFYSTSLYGEYGITDKITGVAYIPLVTRITLNSVRRRQSGQFSPGDELTGIGDPTIGLKYSLLKKGSLAASASLILGIPLGNDSGGETGLLQTGDGEFNQMIRTDLSYSLYPIPIYVTATAAFNNRTKDFSEEFHYGFEAGYTFMEKLLLNLKIYGVESLRNGDPGGSSGQGIFSNNIEYLSLTYEATFFITKNIGVSAAYGTATRAERILAAPAYQFGVFYALKK